MDQFYTICPMCGKKIKAGVKFCPHCGSRFAPEEKVNMICPKCGKVAQDGEKFCSECGTQYATKKTAAEIAPHVEKVQMPPIRTGMPQEEFFERYASKRTKSWVKWMPIIGFISAAIYLILAIVMFASYSTTTGVFMLFDVFVVGGLSYAMRSRRQAWPFLGFAGYNVVASTLAFVSQDFSNLLWLVFSIYLAVKMWKVEQAYKVYLQTGSLPEGAI